METPNLDREIETYKIHKRQGYLSKEGENYLAEFKSIKQLLLHNVNQQRELLAKYTRWQNEVHYGSDELMYADIDKFLTIK